MDYKEKYENLISGLKNWRSKWSGVLTSDGEIMKEFDSIIPELSESEDERIRKALIQFLRDYPHLPNGKYSRSDFFAWLEKQKEQKPNPYTGTGFDYNAHHWGMCARDGGVEIIVDGKIRDRVSFESENIEWSNSVAKEMFIKALERAVEQTKKGYELTDCDKYSWWEDFKAYSEIKPAGWSEEDEKQYKSVLSGLRYAHAELIYHDSTDSAEQVKKAYAWFENRIKYIRPAKKGLGEEEVDAMVKAYSDYLPLCGEFQTYHDALVHTYRQGIEAALNALNSK